MKLYDLLDNDKCYERIRQIRWPDGVTCPRCTSDNITRQGKDESQPERQRYFCKGCQRKFDDLTLSVFSGHHQPLKIWVSCLHLMSLNVSNRQIAQELDLNISDVQKMTEQLRQAVHDKRPDVTLDGEVECDEVYIVAGHKGHPKAVKKKRTIRATKQAERSPWTRHPGKRKASNFWYDSAWWSGCDPHACQC